MLVTAAGLTVVGIGSAPLGVAAGLLAWLLRRADGGSGQPATGSAPTGDLAVCPPAVARADGTAPRRATG